MNEEHEDSLFWVLIQDKSSAWVASPIKKLINKKKDDKKKTQK